MCITYVLYRDSDFNERLKEHFAKAKTNFRKYRRYREKLHHNSKLRELNRLFGISSNGFWKYMKQMQRLKQLITCELKDIRAAYAKTFTERNKFNLDENKVKNELNEFIQKAKTQNSNQQMSFKLERETLITAISSLKNGKAKGTSGVSNEMIKYCQSQVLINSLQLILEKMIQFSVVPDNFNTSIVKPLIKDQNQPGDSVSNLRPIAISNVYSSIFERILLGEIKKESTEHDKQFDFKDNSSCAHAIFVLKQVMLICKLLNRKIYILAIDLSKAFDRIYRPLLWLNMFKRNISAFIVLAFMSIQKL